MNKIRQTHLINIAFTLGWTINEKNNMETNLLLVLLWQQGTSPKKEIRPLY